MMPPSTIPCKPLCKACFGGAVRSVVRSDPSNPGWGMPAGYSAMAWLVRMAPASDSIFPLSLTWRKNTRISGALPLELTVSRLCIPCNGMAGQHKQACPGQQHGRLAVGIRRGYARGQWGVPAGPHLITAALSRLVASSARSSSGASLLLTHPPTLDFPKIQLQLASRACP